MNIVLIYQLVNVLIFEIYRMSEIFSFVASYKFGIKLDIFIFIYQHGHKVYSHICFSYNTHVNIYIWCKKKSNAFKLS